MTAQRITGIIPPVPTPFIDGQLAPDRLGENVEKWCRTGISGILVLGSNGEYVYLSESEKRAVVRIAAAAMPAGMKLIAGSGCESTTETIRLTNDCAALGADAALVVTPAYYAGRMTPAALEAHFTAVADASDIPVLLYNVPKFTRINMSAGTVSRLAEYDNIVGVKDSSGNVAQLGEILNSTGKDFSVLVGNAGALYPALCLGCAGGVLALANVAPDACVKVQTMIRRGLFDEAKQLYLKLLPVNKAVTDTYGVPGLKTALDMMGYFGGDPRSPLQPLDDKEKNEIREILTIAGILPFSV